MLRSRFAPLGALVAASAAVLALAPAAHAQFTITNFQDITPPFVSSENLPFIFLSDVQSISNNGAVVGIYPDISNPELPAVRSFIYQNGTYTTFSYPKERLNDSTTLVGINSAGVLTGYYDGLNDEGIYTGSEHFIRSASGTYSAPLPSATAIIDQYTGVNDAGLVATRYTDGGVARSAVYDINTSSFVQYLPDISAGVGSYISYVGTNGTIVGNYLNSNTSDTGAFLYRNGAYSTFQVAGSLATRFNGINAAGIVSGRYVDADYVSHGLLYNTNTSQYTFFDYPGARETLLFIGSINDSNQIVGNYIGQDGYERSFTATAVAAPEPSALALLASGAMIGSTLVVRRRRKSGK